jgi:hypothetical protein
MYQVRALAVAMVGIGAGLIEGVLFAGTRRLDQSGRAREGRAAIV